MVSFQSWLTSSLFWLCIQDVSKKVSGSNGISAERSTRSKSTKDHAIKSKAKLKGAFSLIGLNNDTFKSKGKRSESTNSETLIVSILLYSVMFQDLVRPKGINWRTCQNCNLLFFLHFRIRQSAALHFSYLNISRVASRAYRAQNGELSLLRFCWHDHLITGASVNNFHEYIQ